MKTYFTHHTFKSTLWIVLILPAVLSLTSCSPKSYFTTAVRQKLETKQIPLNKLQYYVDRDVELRRELASGGAEVEGGKVIFENGHYLHIIELRAQTPGVCVQESPGRMKVAFEVGEGKALAFGVNSGTSENQQYQIFADEWKNNYGKITYDGQEYLIQPEGSRASLMIKKSVINKLKVDKRTMKGVKVE